MKRKTTKLILQTETLKDLQLQTVVGGLYLTNTCNGSKTMDVSACQSCVKA
jgi:hypothetical protein